MAKEDIRILKTKRDLRLGLTSLLKTRSIDKITVCDICEEALINRMTFYKHYMDKRDLLEDLIRYTKSKFVVEKFDENKIRVSPEKCLASAFENIVLQCLENADVLKALTKHNNLVVWDIVYQPFNDAVNDVVSKYNEVRKCKYPIDAVSTFIAGGLIKLLGETLKNDAQPVAEFAQQAEEFFATIFHCNGFFEEY